MNTDTKIKTKQPPQPKQQKVNIDKPIYELQMHDVSLDISNSLQYIRTTAAKLNSKNPFTIFKIEFGFKSMFLTGVK